MIYCSLQSDFKNPIIELLKGRSEVLLKVHKVIKTDVGRITIQENSFGIPELKIRIGDETHKIKCHYGDLVSLEKMVNMLLRF